MKTIQIVSGLNDGGVETLIRGIMEEFSNDLTHEFIFIKHSKKTGILEENLRLRGYPIHYVPGKSRNPVQHIIQMFQLILYYRPDRVHVHMNEHSWLDLLIAKALGVKERIGHIHLFDARDKFITRQVKSFFGIVTKMLASTILVCSVEAGRRIGLRKNVIFYPNAIAINRFLFNSSARNRIRLDLGVKESDIIIGLTARLFYQKNQIFLINLLYLLPQKFKLMLIGDGDDRDILVEATKTLHLEDRVFFMGSLSDVSLWYSAMDVFSMPSLYEGFGISLLEAQVNGLPCLVSNVFPEEVIILDTVKTLDLDLLQWEKVVTSISVERQTPSLNCFSVFDAEKAFKGYYDIH